MKKHIDAENIWIEEGTNDPDLVKICYNHQVIEFYDAFDETTAAFNYADALAASKAILAKLEPSALSSAIDLAGVSKLKSEIADLEAKLRTVTADYIEAEERYRILEAETKILREFRAKVTELTRDFVIEEIIQAIRLGNQ